MRPIHEHVASNRSTFRKSLTLHLPDLSTAAFIVTVSPSSSPFPVSIRIHNIDDPRETVGNLEVKGESSPLTELAWSDDGDTLTVSSAQGRSVGAERSGAHTGRGRCWEGTSAVDEGRGRGGGAWTREWTWTER